MIDRLEAAPIWLHIVVMLGLVVRLTILVVDDRITMVPRKWLQARFATGGYLHYLTWCPWCISVHLSVLAVVAWLTWPGVTLAVAIGGLLAFAAGLIVEHAVHPSPPAPPPHD